MPENGVIANPTGEKALEPDVQMAVSRSVVEPQNARQTPFGGDRWGILWVAAAYADQIMPWGTAPTQRDIQLRAFVDKESFTASAFGTIVARNMAMTWKLESKSDALIKKCERLLHTANWGEGWLSFLSQVWWDVLTQDKGGFAEVIRVADRPEAEPIGIRSLNATDCWHTGDPTTPVTYIDRKSGKYHYLKWYQVLRFREMPKHHDWQYGLQFSAISRVLHFAQIARNIAVYHDEKTGGRHTRAIHVLGGVNKQDLDDAVAKQEAMADNMLLKRMALPVILAAPNQEKPVSAASIDLTTLPEGFDEEKWMKVYITLLALGLFTDYGEFAPLPGGGLGTATQSETMDEKSSKKGAGLFKKTIAGVFNMFLLPDGVDFTWDEDDLIEEKKQADVRKVRADERAVRINSHEIDAETARELAAEVGDLSEEQLAAATSRAAERKAEEEAKAAAGFDQQLQLQAARQPAVAFGQRQIEGVVTEERRAMEEEAATALAKPLARIYGNIKRRLAELEE